MVAIVPPSSSPIASGGGVARCTGCGEGMGRETPARIKAEFAALEAVVSEPAGSAAELQSRLQHVFAELYALDLGRFDVDEAKRAGPELMQSIFALNLGLRRRVGEWRHQGLMSRDVQKALRDAFSASRYAHDMLGEVHFEHPRLGDGERTFSAFTGGVLNTHVNPLHRTGGVLTFQDGDVVLMRGMRHNSAAIARIGDIDSQFSHLAMVHVDAGGQAWIVESLIEDGAVITPLEASLSHDLGRAMLFRHRDCALAQRAARFIHDRVARSRKSHLLRIRYDFSMRPEGYRRLFCSKLVRHAYDAASGGRLKLPTFATRLEMQNRDFFRRIGVRTVETFAPGDIELEPDFDVVAEWRDYRVTSALRLQDMLMDALFAWMDLHGYTFQETLVIRLIGLFGRLSSYLSDDAKELLSGVMPKIPSNMRRRTIGTIAMLQATAQPLFEELRQLEANVIADSGRPVHPREIRDALERVRERLGREIGYLVAKA